MDPSLGPIPRSALPLLGHSSHVSGTQSGLALTAARVGKAQGGRGIFLENGCIGWAGRLGIPGCGYYQRAQVQKDGEAWESRDRVLK